MTLQKPARVAPSHRGGVRVVGAGVGGLRKSLFSGTHVCLIYESFLRTTTHPHRGTSLIRNGDSENARILFLN